uniref:hypothetical protein n=1 Tax=Petrachloros mirabilis TaxID=2918835 RepID=UPI001EE8FB3C|nr:hypothetical protein [Petrachloros mirabilis]
MLTDSHMTQIKANDYPFVEEFVTDNSGRVHKVVLQVEDYQRLLEAIEDEGLYQVMQDVKHEIPLSLNAALKNLDGDEG